jgi:hypothetical protein
MPSTPMIPNLFTSSRTNKNNDKPFELVKYVTATDHNTSLNSYMFLINIFKFYFVLYVGL